jgi:IrrE N-terminal-like domain
MTDRVFTPHKAAILLSHWLDAFAASGADRFPVKVDELALQVGQSLKWADPIVAVRSADIPTFEGGLFFVQDQGWVILYNEKIKSLGRIRFTQAHEVGHYLLHRLVQESFQCSQADMVNWGNDHRLIESQADEFASNLLMPLNHFRNFFDAGSIDFDMLSDASTKFGVSVTAAALRWIQQTESSALLVLARDGFIDWSVSSDKARANGAFFKTRNQVVEVPFNSFASNNTSAASRAGEQVSLKNWFPHAHPDTVAREMLMHCDNYGYSLTILLLSPNDKVWEPREWDR